MWLLHVEVHFLTFFVGARSRSRSRFDVWCGTGCAHLAALVPTQACSASITTLDLRINDVSSASEQGIAFAKSSTQ